MALGSAEEVATFELQKKSLAHLADADVRLMTACRGRFAGWLCAQGAINDVEDDALKRSDARAHDLAHLRPPGRVSKVAKRGKHVSPAGCFVVNITRSVAQGSGLEQRDRRMDDWRGLQR